MVNLIAFEIKQFLKFGGKNQKAYNGEAKQTLEVAIAEIERLQDFKDSFRSLIEDAQYRD